MSYICRWFLDSAEAKVRTPMALPTHFSVKLLRFPLQPTPLYSSISRVHCNACSVLYQKKLASVKRLGLDEKKICIENDTTSGYQMGKSSS